MPPTPVTVVNATTQDVPVYIDEIGTVVASQSVTIMPQVQGQIIARSFKDGQLLKAKDPLFTIDPAPYQAVVDQAQASIKVAEANRDFAQSDFDRVSKLRSTGAISKEDYDTKASALAVNKAQVDSANAAYQTALINRHYCDIVSPIDGLAGTGWSTSAISSRPTRARC